MTHTHIHCNKQKQTRTHMHRSKLMTLSLCFSFKNTFTPVTHAKTLSPEHSNNSKNSPTVLIRNNKLSVVHMYMSKHVLARN